LTWHYFTFSSSQVKKDETLTFPDLDLVVSNVDKYKGIPAVGSRALADALLYSKKEECEADILALISMRMTLSPKQLSLMAAANKVAGCGDILCAINLFKKVLFFFHFISVVFFYSYLLWNRFTTHQIETAASRDVVKEKAKFPHMTPAQLDKTLRIAVRNAIAHLAGSLQSADSSIYRAVDR
jgi:hypothetical protein